MSWFVLVFFVISVSYHPKSEPSKRNELAETIENIVIKLDTISNKLDRISQMIEQL